MLIGIPKETKGRVQSYTATPPAGVRALCEAGHKVFVEKGAGSTCSSEATHPYIEAWWPPGHIIGYEHTFVHVVYDFMKALDEDRMPTPNFADGVECQRVLEAVEKSVKEERWIDVEAKKK